MSVILALLGSEAVRNLIILGVSAAATAIFGKHLIIIQGKELMGKILSCWMSVEGTAAALVAQGKTPMTREQKLSLFFDRLIEMVPGLTDKQKAMAGMAAEVLSHSAKVPTGDAIDTLAHALGLY